MVEQAQRKPARRIGSAGAVLSHSEEPEGARAARRKSSLRAEGGSCGARVCADLREQARLGAHCLDIRAREFVLPFRKEDCQHQRLSGKGERTQNRRRAQERNPSQKTVGQPRHWVARIEDQSKVE